MPSVIQFASNPGKPPSAPRLLVLKLDHRGDFAVSVPALSMLRKLLPEAHITLVISSWNEDFARQRQLADEILIYDFFSQDGAINSRPPEFKSILPGGVNYHLALDLRVDPDTRFLLESVPAEVKCGFSDSSENPFLDLKFNLPDFVRGSRQLALQYIDYDVVSTNGSSGNYRWKAPLSPHAKLSLSVTSILSHCSPVESAKLGLKLGLRSLGATPLRVGVKLSAWHEGKCVGSSSREIKAGLPFLEFVSALPLQTELAGGMKAVRLHIAAECAGGRGFFRVRDIPWFDPDGQASLEYERSLLHRSEQYCALIGACVQRLNRRSTTWTMAE
jgi:hypothetical protein